MIRNSDIDRLRGLFAKRLIATMDMLKKTVGTVADLTVFRKLRELDYCTSYSHRGRFCTLRELAEFDENGLWWIRSVGFSSRGTLVATAEGLVNASEAGYAVEELDAIVRVGTKDVLPKLAWEKRLRRTRIRNRKGVTLILTPIIANCVSARHCRSRNLRLVGMCEQGPGSLEAIALHESAEG